MLCKGTPPWENLLTPTICTCLIDKTATKETLPPILKTCAQETIDSYPATSVHAYTDGSAFKATISAGYGIHMRYPDGSTYNYQDSCGQNCSNYEAEMTAIKVAIEIVHQHFDLQQQRPADLVIFSDSQSVLEALDTHPYSDGELHAIVVAIRSNPQPPHRTPNHSYTTMDPWTQWLTGQ